MRTPHTNNPVRRAAEWFRCRFGPTATEMGAQSVDTLTGAVTGRVRFVSRTDAPLAVGVGAATDGTVFVETDGTYVYVPISAARHKVRQAGGSGTDRFTLTARNRFGRCAVTVRVPVVPTNRAPVLGAVSVDAPDRVTGAVTGSVRPLDRDADAVSWSASRPYRGLVMMACDGTFVYVPTTEARVDAAARSGAVAAQRDSFLIVASDGHDGVAATEVVVAISPVTTAPAG
ncbi:hypothetical protein GCM10007298_05050 [Williamsia phyllosphaerae]|uniref:Uncharacterized protein n=2 Tax=Williamsia phyllosphaerae TaxID=885042 RepID=A0ABQ1U8P6_9NOCA|nr:hypothetical protein GCM10007298_05050 [Williamsia phyllosphaerae]